MTALTLSINPINLDMAAINARAIRTAIEDEFKTTCTPHATDEGAVWVRRDGQTARLVYPDLVEKGRYHCTCGFYRLVGTCSHLHSASMARALFAAEQDQATDEEGRLFMEACRAERAPSVAPEPWPVCGFHGPHQASLSGEPMSFCERCWNR